MKLQKKSLGLATLALSSNIFAADLTYRAKFPTQS